MKMSTELWAHFPPPSPLPFLSHSNSNVTVVQYLDTQTLVPILILDASSVICFFFVSKIDKSRKTHFKIERTSKHLSPLFCKLFCYPSVCMSARPSFILFVCDLLNMRLSGFVFFLWSSLCRTFTVVLTTSNRYCNHC